MNTQQDNPDMINQLIANRLRHALWALLAGDALAAPTHWFYGGFQQIQAIYGPQGIVNYTQPTFNLPGSILNKSNLNGGGRSSRGGIIKRKHKPNVVGDVILHGKQDYWAHHRQIHYHATLQAGETTLEGTLCRVLWRNLTSTAGRFEAANFRQAYIQFMTTPGSHNDTYASTCHRMFFANLVHHQLDPVDCPDNDNHNVLTIDGLVLPTVTALTTAAILGHHSKSGDNQGIDDAWQDTVGQAASATVAVTRKSKALEKAAYHWGVFLGRALLRSESAGSTTVSSLPTLVHLLAHDLDLPRPPHPRNTLTACYLDSALPALLDQLLLASNGQTIWKALLDNANTGGENVHRGACLGATLGLFFENENCMDNDGTQAPPLPDFARGLYQAEEIQNEIEAFVDVVLAARQQYWQTMEK